MRVRINMTELPVEQPKQPLEPITIEAAISNADGTIPWIVQTLELDCGADTVSIPLPILSAILGEKLELGEPIVMETADGTQSSVQTAKISLRFKCENGEVVTLHDVDCITPESGSVLLGRNVLNVFKITLVQNEIRSMVLTPKMATWMGLQD